MYYSYGKTNTFSGMVGNPRKSLVVPPILPGTSLHQFELRFCYTFNHLRLVMYVCIYVYLVSQSTQKWCSNSSLLSYTTCSTGLRRRLQVNCYGVFTIVKEACWADTFRGSLRLVGDSIVYKKNANIVPTPQLLNGNNDTVN